MLGSTAAVETLALAVDDDHYEMRTETVAALAQVASDGPASAAARRVLLSALHGELVPPPQIVETPEQAVPEGEPRQPSPATEAIEPDAGVEAWPKTTLQAINDAELEAGGSPPSTSQSTELEQSDLDLLALASARPMKKHALLNPPVVMHEDVRRLAARVLGDVAQTIVAEALAVELADEDLELRRRAADSLGRVGRSLGGLPADARDALLGCMEDSDRDLRLAATRSLGVTTKAAVTALTLRLKDSDSFVRAEAARALAALGAAPEELLDLLSEEDPGTRLAGAAAIAMQGAGAALTPLMDLAFAFEGLQVAEVASLLRDLDRETANGRLVTTLRNTEERSNWRIAINVLKELNRASSEPAPRMVA
ncbi:MAG: HEAT repeat domain-containing protein [Alphaproteobacteria bacterium]